jgi:hypothetical protein
VAAGDSRDDGAGSDCSGLVRPIVSGVRARIVEIGKVETRDETVAEAGGAGESGGSGASISQPRATKSAVQPTVIIRFRACVFTNTGISDLPSSQTIFGERGKPRKADSPERVGVNAHCGIIQKAGAMADAWCWLR